MSVSDTIKITCRRERWGVGAPGKYGFSWSAYTAEAVNGQGEKVITHGRTRKGAIVAALAELERKGRGNET